MILLDTDVIALELVLEAPVATNELEWTYTVTDIDQATLKLSDAWGFAGVTNGATPVEVIPAPDDGTTRQVKLLTVFNADTVAAVVRVRRNDDGTITHYWRETLEPGETLQFVG